MGATLTSIIAQYLTHVIFRGTPITVTTPRFDGVVGPKDAQLETRRPTCSAARFVNRNASESVQALTVLS